MIPLMVKVGLLLVYVMDCNGVTELVFWWVYELGVQKKFQVGFFFDSFFSKIIVLIECEQSFVRAQAQKLSKVNIFSVVCF